MKRGLAILLAAALLGGCRGHDRYTPLVDQAGLIPADQFALYGHEQAQAIAIGREFGTALETRSVEGFEKQTADAVEYARSLPDVIAVQADTVGHLLTVTFKSGWRTAVLPIADGKRGNETEGLPPAARR
jgi:hypothetical protein